MQQEYCHILISASNKKEADKISDNLLKNKLIAGLLVLKGPAKYWWKGHIEEREYYNISAFSLFANKFRIINVVNKISNDTTPVIEFLPMDGDKKFLQWVKETVKLSD